MAIPVSIITSGCATMSVRGRKCLDYLREENEYGRQVMATQRNSLQQERVLKRLLIVSRVPAEVSTRPTQQKWLPLSIGIYEAGCGHAIYQRPVGATERGVG